MTRFSNSRTAPYSIVAHGAPDASFTGAMLGELATAAAILQAR